MKKIKWILPILLLLLVGCSGVDISKLSDEDMARISDKAIICNDPYIRVGMECCLDQNNNNICDKDEINDRNAEQQTTQTIETQQTNTHVNNEPKSEEPDDSLESNSEIDNWWTPGEPIPQTLMLGYDIKGEPQQYELDKMPKYLRIANLVVGNKVIAEGVFTIEIVDKKEDFVKVSVWSKVPRGESASSGITFKVWTASPYTADTSFGKFKFFWDGTRTLMVRQEAK